jgi:uncharacterized protein involved in tolerance to divalent cations
MNGFCVVLTTTDSEAHAERIVDAVLEAKLAACLQADPDQELLCMGRQDCARQ